MDFPLHLISLECFYQSLLSDIYLLYSINIFSPEPYTLCQFQFIFVFRVHRTVTTSLLLRVCWTVYSRLVRYLGKHKNWTRSRNVLIKRLLLVIWNLLKQRFSIALQLLRLVFAALKVLRFFFISKTGTFASSVKPLCSGHHWDLRIVSVRHRRPLHGGSSHISLFCLRNLLYAFRG